MPIVLPMLLMHGYAWRCHHLLAAIATAVILHGHTATGDRAAFPWLMTWEENRSRKNAPWLGRTLCRGLEISSYAFATSRRENVERGRLLDTPTFEWLDANETKVSTWYMSLQMQAEPGSATGAELCALG